MIRIEMTGTITEVVSMRGCHMADLNVAQLVSVGNVRIELSKEEAVRVLSAGLPLMGRLILELDSENEGDPR